MAFNKKAFDPKFQAAVVDLAASEKTTKAVLMSLSRSVLEAVQVTEDVAYMNTVVNALTPVNRKMAVLFFVTFSGFRCENGVFTKKDKKNYEAIKAETIKAMEDPHFNIWSWAEKEIEVEKKEFTLDRISKTVESVLKKADKAGFSQAETLAAIIAGGLDVNALMVLLQGGKPEEKQVPEAML